MAASRRLMVSARSRHRSCRLAAASTSAERLGNSRAALMASSSSSTAPVAGASADFLLTTSRSATAASTSRAAYEATSLERLSTQALGAAAAKMAASSCATTSWVTGRRRKWRPAASRATALVRISVRQTPGSVQSWPSSASARRRSSALADAHSRRQLMAMASSESSTKRHPLVRPAFSTVSQSFRHCSACATASLVALLRVEALSSKKQARVYTTLASRRPTENQRSSARRFLRSMRRKSRDA
mmetsp:Transcript_5922/g.15212  ORF Transcript_5922/g.15212 Transcript_5922/m.15212 type:complete len:245 (-) Transcript_5922:103-837(-)